MAVDKVLSVPKFHPHPYGLVTLKLPAILSLSRAGKLGPVRTSIEATIFAIFRHLRALHLSSSQTAASGMRFAGHHRFHSISQHGFFTGTPGSLLVAMCANTLERAEMILKPVLLALR